MTPAQIDAFFAALQAAIPQPVAALEYSSVFELLFVLLEYGSDGAPRQEAPAWL